MNRREFLTGSLAAGGAAALGGCRTAEAPDLPPNETSGRISHRIFWTWDHSTNWTLNAMGEIAPFPAFTGSVPVSISCTEPEKASARVDFVKHYVK